MNMRRGIRRYFRLRPQPGEVAAHVDDEIRLHMELRVQRLMALGMSEDEARAEAERRFGEAARTRRALERSALQREARISMREQLASWLQDVRYSVRALVREPLFSLMVIATLALGIGANATMFGIIDRLLLQGPAHVAAPEQVMRLYVTTSPAGMEPFTGQWVGYASYLLLDAETDVFEGAAAYTLRDARIGRGEDAREIRMAYGSADLFPLLGVQPVLGRFYTAEEDRPNAARNVVVIDEGFWRTQLGAARDAIGSTLVLNDAEWTIVGVAPEGFTGPQLEPVALWAPMSAHPPVTPGWTTVWGVQWLQVVARLKPGITTERASEQATAAYAAAYDGDDAAEAAARLSLRPLHYSGIGNESPELRIARWLVGVSAIVLLIACANVANLLLARMVRRRREIGVRLALGISRARLVRLLLTDSLVLAFAAGVAALAVAHWGGHLMRVTLLPDVAWTEPPLSLRVLLFSGGVALLVGLMLGVLPALLSQRQDLAGTLKSGAREGGGSRSRMRAALTIAQATLSVVLLVGAGLFVRSLANARNADLGLEPERVLAVGLSFPSVSGLSDEERAAARAGHAQVYMRALERAQALPDVEAAALGIGMPFQSWFTVRLAVPGRDSIPQMPGGGPYISAVSAGYFAVTGVEIVRGRGFTAADRAGSEPVTIVNETMAATLWPGVEAIGKCLLIGREPEGCARVVGVAEVARRQDIREPASMQYYIPFGQERGIGGTTLLVRPRGDATAASIATLRRALLDVDPAIRYVGISSMQDDIDPLVRPWRLGATMFTLFGLLALLIAAVGLYSVIAYGVTQRRAELGIRMALGARARDVVRMVLAEGVGYVMVGAALGVLIALFAGRWLETLLFETSVRDTGTFAGVVGVLLAVAVIASLVPALRAGRVDPMEAVRGE